MALQAVQVDPDKISAAIAAIKEQDGDAALSILEAILTGGSSDSSGSDAAPENGDGSPPPSDGSAPAATGRLEPAAAAALMRLTGCKTEAEALANYKAMQEQVQAQASATAAVELNTRRGLIADLIKLGIETPATAWLGATPQERDARNPKKRLLDEPIEELADRVAQLKKRAPAPLPPQGGGPREETTLDVAAEVAKLTSADLSRIKKAGKTPEEFVRAKAAVVVRRA